VNVGQLNFLYFRVNVVRNVLKQNRSTNKALLDSRAHKSFDSHFNHLKSLNMRIVEAMKETWLGVDALMFPKTNELFDRALVDMHGTYIA
jgi:hypothetical protein